MFILLLILHTIILLLIIQCNCFNNTYYCTNNQWNPFADPLHISALILARGGSKGILLKNLAKLGNNSLISNALQQIKAVHNFNSIWVSTDNNLIASEVNKLNSLVHWRSEYTATDEASSLIAVQEFIHYHPEIDIVGLIQCTSPFIKKQYLIEAIRKFDGNPKLDCVFSVTRSFKLRWHKVQDHFVPLNFNIDKRPRRQDLNGEFIENASVPSFYREIYDVLSSDGEPIDKNLFKYILNQQTEISQQTVKQIWDMCGIENNSGINRTCLYKVLACIAFAQNGKTPSETLLENYNGKEFPTPNLGDISSLRSTYNTLNLNIMFKNGLNVSYNDIMRMDTITIDLVPEKKGIFIKHSEYLVSSRKLNTTVKRRYNDFVTFHELLIIRFPYRLIPRLPPKKIVSDSHFLESRRRALQRWLTLVARHPIVSSSSLLIFFLSDTSPEHQQKIKETFKSQPDEFATSDLAAKAKELLPSDTNLQFAASREQINNIWCGVRKLLYICERGVARGRALAQDAQDLSGYLRELAAESHDHSQWGTGGNTIWSDIKKGFGIIYKEFSSLSTSAIQTANREEDTVCERLNLLSDILAAHVSLCERLEKGVLSDHQRALSQMLNLKKKQIQGVIKGTDAESVDQLESKMMQQVNVISDMELRNAFSLYCVRMETQLVHIYLELLASVFNSMMSVQIQSHTELADVWKTMQPTVTKYLPEKSKSHKLNNTI